MIHYHTWFTNTLSQIPWRINLVNHFKGFWKQWTVHEILRQNNVIIDILDEYADNKDAILHTLAVLQDKLQVGTQLNFLGVAGDGKTYDHLHALKIEYGADLNSVWLIPLPGDWHILKNY